MTTNKLTGSTVLVTGGTGFVGSHLVEALLPLASVVTTFQTINPHSYFHTQNLDDKVIMTNTDVNDFEKLLNIVTKYNVDYIFHLAAQPLVEVAYHNPRQTLYSNIVGTMNVLECGRLFPHIKGIVVASSDKAYGKLSKDKYVETDALQGDHPYEVSKSAADLICNSYFKTYNLPVVTTRFGNIYGEGDLNYSRIIPGSLRSLVTKEKLAIRSDGTHVRDYLYVKDVAEGYILIAKEIEKVKGEAFNFGSEDSLSVLDLLKHIEKTLSQKINYSVMNTAKNEIPYQSLDYSKIQKALGWKPRHTLTSTIKNVYEWYTASVQNEKN